VTAKIYKGVVASQDTAGLAWAPEEVVLPIIMIVVIQTMATLLEQPEAEAAA